MKRLTKRWGEQPYPNLAGKVVCEYKECDSTRSCEDCIHGQYKDRLAAIEDILGDEYDLDRLREIVEADREGRCVVLPCKIFDKIWNVAAHYQFEVTEIDLLPYGNILFRCGNKGTDDYAAFYGDDLGDTFTFEEPQERDNCVVKEAALRREQDE